MRDPENGTTESGVNWARFTVAVNRRYHREGEPEADYIRVTVWRSLADICVKYLRKGRKVACVGESSAYGWIRQDGRAGAQIEMTANDVEFISSGRRDEGGPSDPPVAPEWAERGAEADGYDGGAQQERQMNFTEVETEDLPF